MPNKYCDICLSNGRPLRFVSDRIHICQWCVTLLKDTPIDPQNIESHLMGIIKKHVRMSPEEPNKDEIWKKAYSYVKSQESILESIFTSVFNKEKREKKVHEIFNRMLEQANASHKDEMAKYQIEIKEEIQEKYQKLLSGKYMPLELTSLDKKYVKYIRAYNHHILSGNQKQFRPDDQFMRQLREDIKRQDGYQCKICSKGGKNVELHVHHIIPLDKFGSNHPNNLITLCHSCHNKQHPEFQVTRNLPIRRVRNGGEFIALDIETTGLSFDDQIIELGAVKFKAAQAVAEYCTLVKPTIPIPKKITSLTGITDLMVANAPYIDEIFHEFLNFLGDFKLISHNSAFDMRFLRMCAQELGYQKEIEIEDTLQLSRKKIPHLKNHKLQTLVRFFNIATNGKHRALADSYATAQVYIECLRLRKNSNRRTKR